ncbi:hypothetical protein B0H11DRAFT_2231770 [Mycena galericulata]|nr:hypothetical protein B0H11DRAFT_2231770 [Mycena galericulata]
MFEVAGTMSEAVEKTAWIRTDAGDKPCRRKVHRGYVWRAGTARPLSADPANGDPVLDFGMSKPLRQGSIYVSLVRGSGTGARTKWQKYNDRKS